MTKRTNDPEVDSVLPAGPGAASYAQTQVYSRDQTSPRIDSHTRLALLPAKAARKYP